MKTQLLLLTSIFLFNITNAQRLSRPREIKAGGDYMHAATATIFPAGIDGYERSEITTFDKQRNEIAARYEQKSRDGKTTISVYVYPAEEASNYRFRSQYWASAQSIAIAADRELKAVQTYRSVAKDGYKIHGFNAFITDGKQNTALELYECGNWFFKIRTTSDYLDSTRIYQLNQRIVSVFDPVNLVKHSTITPQPTISLNERAFADSLLMGFTIARALAELSWANDNVDSLEWLAGFPALYLEMHVASLKEAVKFANGENYQGVSQKTMEFMRQLRAIIDNNYLEQFVLEEYDMLLTSKFPDKLYNFKDYYAWKKKNRIDIKLEPMYAISYVEGSKRASKRR